MLRPFILLAFSFVFASNILAEENKPGARPITEPGIVLTFDDSSNLESWAKRIPLLKKYGAKATFFLDKPDRIDEKQQDCMKRLADAGCEMACHGLRHKSAVSFVEKEGVEGPLLT